MLPPPPPMVFTSTMGARTGYGPMNPPDVMSGLPPLTIATSLLVPPMSRETKSGTSDRSAAKRAPTTPAAGPERKSVTGCRAASPADTIPRPGRPRPHPRRHDTAPRPHHERHTWYTETLQHLGQPAEVALHHRPQVRVERGDAEPLVLAEGRVYLGGEGDADLRRDFQADLPGAPLVGGIDEGEEIAHRDGLRAVPLEGGHLAPHLLLVERQEHGA